MKRFNEMNYLATQLFLLKYGMLSSEINNKSQIDPQVLKLLLDFENLNEFLIH